MGSGQGQSCRCPVAVEEVTTRQVMQQKLLDQVCFQDGGRVLDPTTHLYTTTSHGSIHLCCKVSLNSGFGESGGGIQKQTGLDRLWVPLVFPCPFGVPLSDLNMMSYDSDMGIIHSVITGLCRITGTVRITLIL